MSLLKIQSCLECLGRLARVGGVRIGQDERERGRRRENQRIQKASFPSFLFLSLPEQFNSKCISRTKRQKSEVGEAAAQNWREEGGVPITRRGGYSSM